ncbi:MAG: UvrD-helicase domain-containing protein [Oligoflexales bacterium]|nr:UvrD-helicase domain-containing protein [Oligoflexales bacterium]
MLSPQNPYDSFVVQASAGSGKTYQLSRRFLNLVGAGADPKGILTITFTVKACQEMKDRIIFEAKRLLSDPVRQKEFERELQDFYEQLPLSPPCHPRTAVTTGMSILASIQALKVLTIDALFYEWVSRFPWECGLSDEGASSPFTLMSSHEINELNKKSWERLFSSKDLRVGSESVLSLCETLMRLDPDQGILGLEKKVFELFRHQTFAWQNARTYDVLFRHPNKDWGTSSSSVAKVSPDPSLLLENIGDQLKAIASVTQRKEQLIASIEKQDLAGLYKEKLLTKENKISGVLIRGKKREVLASEIETVDTALLQFFDQAKITKLNESGRALFLLYQAWEQQRSLLKKAAGSLEFADLAMGVFRLIKESTNSGALWLLQKSVQHLLLDEFQDTSFLQWSIFEEFISEMLSGQNYLEGELPSTVFIVGDKKQSVYGFREAFPGVLDEASVLLTNTFSKSRVLLDQNFRSCRLILDFVNKLFHFHFDPDFPLHKPGRKNSSDPEDLIPDMGRILIHEEFTDFCQETGTSAVQREAKFVAKHLKTMLSDASYKVWDSKIQAFKNLTPKDCVILYRNSTHVEIFEEALQAERVPFVREESKGFFDRPEICDAIALMKFFATPSDQIALCTVLSSPFLAVPDPILLGALEESLKSANPWERSQLILDSIQKMDFPRKGDFEKFRSLLNDRSFLLPHQIFFQVLSECSVLASYKSFFSSIEGLLAEKNLIRFCEFLLTLEEEGFHHLQACVRELLKKQSSDELDASEIDREAVRLMTIHKSKGLEFPLVVLVETSDLWYKQDRYWVKVIQPSYKGLAYIGTSKDRPQGCNHFSSLLTSQTSSLQEESTRLLYVALTRASQYLLITAHREKKRDLGLESFFPLLKDTLQSMPEWRTLGQSGDISFVERYNLAWEGLGSERSEDILLA